MRSIRTFSTILGSFALSVMLFGCEKKDKITNDAEALDNLQQISKDHAMVESEFNSVFNTVDHTANEDTAIAGEKSASTILPSCASTTFDVSTKTLTIDFGTTNCLCSDGLNRRGKIVAVFDGKYRTKGTKVTVTLDQYFVEDIEYKGTKTIENLGNASGNYKYSYKVTNAQAITTTGTISWNTDATIERVEGDSTITPWDDVYEMTGQSNGVNRKGVSFTVNVDASDPLVRRISLNPLCWRNFVSGKLTITDGSGNVSTLDYDPKKEGKCDKEAELVVNGRPPFTIILR
jgi:hypothetical protein